MYSMSSSSTAHTTQDVNSILSTIWGDEPIMAQSKSIWSVNDKDKIVNSRTGRGAVKDGRGVTFPGPAMFQEAAKGGRLFMDEVYNQLEELEMERRMNEGDLRLTPTPFTPLRRGQFDWNGLAAMLLDVRGQFGLFVTFIKTLEDMRAEAESRAMSLSPTDRVALIHELFTDNKETADDLRQGFNKLLESLFESWESKMAAVHRGLFPLNETSDRISKETVKLDVMPYLLKELGEVVRVSRVTLFTVRKRYDEVCRRVIRKTEYEQSMQFPKFKMAATRIDPAFPPRKTDQDMAH